MNPTQVATYPTCIHGYVLLAKRDEPRIKKVSSGVCMCRQQKPLQQLPRKPWESRKFTGKPHNVYIIYSSHKPPTWIDASYIQFMGNLGMVDLIHLTWKKNGTKNI